MLTKLEPQRGLFWWFFDFCDSGFSPWIINMTLKWETFLPETDFLWCDPKAETKQASLCFYKFRKFLHQLLFLFSSALFQYLIYFKYYSNMASLLNTFFLQFWISSRYCFAFDRHLSRKKRSFDFFFKLVSELVLVRSAESFCPWPQMELPTLRKGHKSQECAISSHTDGASDTLWGAQKRLLRL